MASGEFSVYWWDIKGEQIEELRGVSAEDAVKAAKRLTSEPSKLICKEVRITDGGDLLNFHWLDGVILFPTREQIAATREQ